MIVTQREREAETQAEGEAGSMHWEPDVGFDPGSPGSRPGPKAGTKPLRHPGIPTEFIFKWGYICGNPWMKLCIPKIVAFISYRCCLDLSSPRWLLLLSLLLFFSPGWFLCLFLSLGIPEPRRQGKSDPKQEWGQASGRGYTKETRYFISLSLY